MLQDRCQAYAEDAVQLLPIKTKKIVVVSRHFQYIMLRHEDKVYVQQRGQGDIWQNLYDFPLIETESSSDFSELKLKIK
jgi:A/G-specific adenine glycosylase